MEKPSIKIIKKAKHERPQVLSDPGFVVDANRWSRAVRSWVVEFKSHTRKESTPAFDRLFLPADQQMP